MITDMQEESYVIQEQSQSEKALITSALNLFTIQQDKNITVSQLIKAAGISKSIFYRYFANIDDVYSAILLLDEMQMTPLLNQYRTNGTVSDLLEGFLKYRIQQFEKYRVLVRLEQYLTAKGCDAERFKQWQNLRRQHAEEFASIVEASSSQLHGIDKENLRFYYGMVWAVSNGVVNLLENDFFHELIKDRRGFTRFLMDAVSQIGKLKL